MTNTVGDTVSGVGKGTGDTLSGVTKGVGDTTKSMLRSFLPCILTYKQFSGYRVRSTQTGQATPTSSHLCQKRNWFTRYGTRAKAVTWLTLCPDVGDTAQGYAKKGTDAAGITGDKKEG